MKKLLTAGVALFLNAAVQAAPVPLLDSIKCSLGNQTNGIVISDVTGDNGGATECWGTYDGSDPGSSGDGYEIGGDVYDYVAKKNTGGSLEGADIGLVVTPSGGAEDGKWSFDMGALDEHNFLIVLKAASKPGYAVWLFSGTDATSYSGSWHVAWGSDLSHLSIYKGPSGDDPGGQVPEPATLGLMGLGLAGLRIGAKRRRKR